MSAPQVFDRRLVRRRRDRAAAGFAGYDFLAREVAERLADRLTDVRRRFPLALELGCRDGTLAGLLQGRGGIETLVQADLSPAMARRAAGNGNPALALDEEALPFGPGSFDLVVSAFSLHWVNDLPGALAQIRWLLKPDGLFLAALPGGRTLVELGQSLMQAELAVSGGASPRVSPFVEVKDAGMLLQRAGFALPVVDLDQIPVSYADPLALLRDLRGMGETSALAERPRRPARRSLFLEAAARYPRRPDGRCSATVEIVYLTGWAPHPEQQRPAPRGSGHTSLAQALKD